MKHLASCICGAVKIEIDNPDPNFTVCHCYMCRTWGGGPLFALKCGSEVVFSGNEKIKQYTSSPWAKRGFCGECGTHLFYKLIDTQEYNIPLGLLPSLPGLKMSIQYFSDMRPNYYCFTNETQEMTSEDIVSFFSNKINPTA
ncbi:TPA: GFA family protein [Vibrio alginolyticus]|nr:GFA family protein [Vibrio alginolyticus]